MLSAIAMASHLLMDTSLIVLDLAMKTRTYCPEVLHQAVHEHIRQLTEAVAVEPDLLLVMWRALML